jgi:hypothetical protein
LEAVVIAQVVLTLVLVGLILTIQVVHYPLLAAVGPSHFAAYHAEHARRISLLVVPLMTAELTLAAWLAVETPAFVPRWSAWLGLALAAAIWLSTFLAQIPRHAVLARGFDACAHAALVAGNWIRTAGWIARGALGCWWLLRIADAAHS